MSVAHLMVRGHSVVGGESTNEHAGCQVNVGDAWEGGCVHGSELILSV
jgi:hypothetical protein